MSLSTSVFIVVCLLGSCRPAPKDNQDLMVLTMETLARMQDKFLQKIDGLQNKMTSLEESIETMEERIIRQQVNMRTSMQQCLSIDQIITCQRLIEKDECEEGSAKCNDSATCTDDIGHFKCVCLEGYSGDGFSCEDINECISNDAICGEGNTCINHPGTYSCLCHDGFKEVNNVCIDVDECSENNVCGVDQKCSNFPGGYNCTCLQKGYEDGGDNCQDINECASDEHLCSAHATCTNTKGSYVCECLPYYIGDGFTCIDCQTELSKATKVFLDTFNLGMDDLTPATEEILMKSLEQKEPQCVRKPTGSDCKELLDNGAIASGVYTITPKGFPDGVKVYCDQGTDGGGWTVIFQRKPQTQQLSFGRTFEEYAAGFGDPNGEIWIGNRVIHSLTADEPSSLRVKVMNIRRHTKIGVWDSFRVGSENTQFTLSIDGYSPFSTLGDGLTVRNSWGTANGMKFSTYDRDNDGGGGDCSRNRGNGGWWYNDCGYANPTGPFGDADENYGTAFWGYWVGSSSYKATGISEILMKIRPKRK